MEVVPLICPKCGADLDVPDGVEVFRCQYCGSKCQVKASGSVRGLALLEPGVQKVVQHTERTADGIDELVAAKKSEISAHQQARARWATKLSDLEAAHRSAKTSTAVSLLLGLGLPIGGCALY